MTSEDAWLDHLKTGNDFIAKQDYPAAIEALTKSIALNEQWDTYRGLGWALFRTNNYPASIDAFNKSIALNEQWDTYQGLGWALFRTNNYPAAIDAFNKSIALNEQWDTYLGLGKALFRTNNYPAAIDAFNKSIALNEQWDTYQDLGKALLPTYNYSAAIDAFNKSIALNKKWDTYQGLGWAFFRTNNYSASIDAFKKSIALKENWDTYRGLGWALFRTNNYSASIDAFKKSIALKENWNIYQGLGWALFRTNNYSASIDAFKKSIALKESWNTYQVLGWALFHINNHPAAIDAFNKSITLNENWDTYRGLGWAHCCTNNYLKALHASVNSFIYSRSTKIKMQFHDICMHAVNDKSIDDNIVDFVKYGLVAKEQWEKIYLKKYVLKCIQTLSIDPLLLRMASFLIRQKNVESFNPREEDLLDYLNEYSTTEKNDLSEIRRFHRHVFGVSHALLHRASPNTTVVHCGAGTMFSIGNPESRTKHFQMIQFEIETIEDPTKSVLIFEFGEVDIRKHIFQVARKKSQSIYKIADSSISRYIEFIKSIKNKGFNIMISGPHCGGGEHPSIEGTSPIERNDICAYINDALALACRENDFYFFTLFDKVVNQKTLIEITGLYSDHHHLCLPPSKIGNALNALLNQRVDGAFSRVRSRHQAFQQEEVHAECTVVFSDVPNWHSGTVFYPGKETKSKQDHFEIGQYIQLIELPFLMHPKQVTLEFKQSVLSIKTEVQGVLESWDIYKNMQSGNIVTSLFDNNDESPIDSSMIHSFASQNSRSEMCRFLIVRISSNTIGNCLTKISLKRWTHHF